MRHNFISSAKLATVLIMVLVAAGCSETPNEPLVVNTNTTDASKSYSESSSKPQSSYIKRKFKNMFTQKKTVWDRMLSLYALPDYSNERIDRELNWYLSHPDYIARIQDRAAPYMHLILDEIEAKNLPGELALLPVVESAFIPEAYSRSDASGLWQFIPSTGRLFGLEQNSWYDGRRDVFASTKAAANFLQGLGDTFDGDWCLALASYNYGKGNIRKAINRNVYDGLPTNYWALDLPKETMDYVPRLLAVAKLFANADRYGIRLQNIPNKRYCEVVNVGSQIDLDKAAQLANTPLHHFLKLNPGFKKESTAPEGPHRLLVPIQHVSAFKTALARLPYEERVDQRRRDQELLAEKIRQNELMAKKMREEEDRLEEQRRHEVIVARSELARKSALSQAKHEAQRAAKAKSTGYFKGAPVQQASAVKSKSASPQQVYTVKKGDTFFNISKRFAVSRSDIANWNKISPNSNVKLGQKLKIKGSVQQVASASASKLVHYSVKKGDSLNQLSRKFGVSVNDLRKSNPGVGNKGIRPGQSLKVIVVSNDRAT
jgi:membrane-bound lytic murein transglycosylase D